MTQSVHASAVQVGERAVLIRGPSGSGKSRLALALIAAGRTGMLPPSVLVGDDRIVLEARDGLLVATPAPGLEGRIEVYGAGIRRTEFVLAAPVMAVIDLADADAQRMPANSAMQVTISGITLPRLPVVSGHDPFPQVVSWLTTDPDW
jgi:serine kinase of HPr protein (carbohydrate metabolism regulator)